MKYFQARNFCGFGGLMLALFSLAACATTSTGTASATTTFIPAKRLNTTSPLYPEKAFENNESASLQLVVDVDQNGRPHNCRIITTNNHHFDESALDFCNRSQFQPASRNGVAVSQRDVPFPVAYTME